MEVDAILERGPLRAGGPAMAAPDAGLARRGFLRAAVAVSAAAGLPAIGHGRPALARGAALLRYRVVPERSEVRYRVREQLAGLSFPNDAVGVARAVEGSVAFDAQGRIVGADSKLTVDVRQLTSDEGRRDGYLRRNTLDTDRYPTVLFVPSEVRGLKAPLPRTGTATLELVGDLTVRDVTRRVTWEARATFNGAEVAVRATTEFPFAEFGLRIPRVASVLSVEDRIRLEADLVLRPAV